MHCLLQAWDKTLSQQPSRITAQYAILKRVDASNRLQLQIWSHLPVDFWSAITRLSSSAETSVNILGYLCSLLHTNCSTQTMRGGYSLRSTCTCFVPWHSYVCHANKLKTSSSVYAPYEYMRIIPLAEYACRGKEKAPCNAFEAGEPFVTTFISQHQRSIATHCRNNMNSAE